MLIDDYLPDAEFDIVRMEMIDADPATTMAAVRSANLLRSRFGRVMSSARDLPNRVARWVRREPVDPKPISFSFGDMTESDEWKLLAESPHEFVAGAIGRFWQRDYGWADFEPAEFTAFEAPDHAKTVIGLKAVAYGPDRTLLVYESRTSTTDGDGLPSLPPLLAAPTALHRPTDGQRARRHSPCSRGHADGGRDHRPSRRGVRPHPLTRPIVSSTGRSERALPRVLGFASGGWPARREPANPG